MHNCPEFWVYSHLCLERIPEERQVVELGQEDGDAGVGYEVENREKSDPHVHDESASTSLARIEEQVLPDDILWLGSKANCGSLRVLAACSKCNRMSRF